MSKQDDSQVSSSGSQTTFAPGTQILGKFQIVQRNQEDQGHSFLCKRINGPRQGELVVLKIFGKARVAEDMEKAAIRFQHEIVAAYSVKHDNVAQIIETVRVGDIFGYIMEYAEGDSLATILDGRSGIEPAKALHILRQICAGAQAIHAAGIVHRALKPSNIMVTRTGAVKIRDFGLAKLDDQKRLTQAGALVGTLAYVSPEYVLEGKCDHRLDIYSIGIIGFEMLCGITPFENEDFVKMFTARVTQPIPRPEQFNPACPPEFGGVILRALQANPVKRFQSVAEMFEALDQVPLNTSNAFNITFGADLALKHGRVTHVFSSPPIPPPAANAVGLPSMTATSADPAPAVATGESFDEIMSAKRAPQNTKTLSGAFMEKFRRAFWTKK